MNKYNITRNPKEADVIWYLAPWNYEKYHFKILVIGENY